MSCRLVRVAGTVAVPVFEPLPSSEDLPGEPVSDEAASAVRRGEEESSLRQRIQALETSLPSAVEEARRNALQEGERAGFERATAATRPVLDRLAQSLKEIGEIRARVRNEAERDAVALSLAIARRILRREISIDPDAVHGLVLAALEKLQSREITRVRVSPDQEESIRRCLAAAHAGAVEVFADPSLSAGDVVVETSRGNLDASIDTQLAEIERGFADRIR